MNPLFLDEAGFSRLHHLYHQESPPHVPSPVQRREIGRILASSDVSGDAGPPLQHVGFGDEVTLVSTEDATDDFVLRVVMPGEADPDNGLVSVLMPVSLAILGRGEGSVAIWDANGNQRKMRISSIRKAVPVAGEISSA